MRIAAVSLQNVTVEHDGVLTQFVHVDDRTQGDQSGEISWVRRPRGPSATREEERVLVARGGIAYSGGHPALTFTLEPARHASVKDAVFSGCCQAMRRNPQHCGTNRG